MIHVKYQLAPLRAQRTRSFNGFLGDLSALRGKKLTPIEFSDSLLGLSIKPSGRFILQLIWNTPFSISWRLAKISGQKILFSISSGRDKTN
jgi:hypothetical protein